VVSRCVVSKVVDAISQIQRMEMTEQERAVRAM
jgi:hypothetical protein